MVAGLSALRVVLCRTSQPLPVQCALDLLRGSRLLAGTAAATLLADWVSVVLRANRANWDAVSGLEVGLLVVASALTARAAFAVRRATARMPGGTVAAPGPATPAAPGPAAAALTDWLGDVVLTVRVHSGLLGPWQGPADRMARWADRRVVTLVRRHPLMIAAALSAGFGLAFAGAQALGEGIPLGQVSAMYFTVSACAMYAFIVAGGAYLGLVRSDRPSRGAPRRLADAAAAGCAAMPLAIAFRQALWALAGSPGETFQHLWSLLLVATAATAVAVFTLETLSQTHRQ